MGVTIIRWLAGLLGSFKTKEVALCGTPAESPRILRRRRRRYRRPLTDAGLADRRMRQQRAARARELEEARRAGEIEK